MGQLSFFIAIVAACLLWSAAFTAAAARTRPGWLRWILLAAALIAPPLALAPLVLITGGFAVLGFETNWFAATFTSLLAAAIGGAWIVIAGLAPRATPAAAAWPLGGLAAMCVLAKAVAAGILLIIDSDVAAEGRRLRIEAAEIVAAALPPAPAPDDDAAPLYQRAFAAIAADTSLDAPQSAFWTSLMTDAETPQVAAILARHVATLDLLRRAADKPGCRFDRDWSRLSIDMQLPEIREMRQASLLLMLAARTAAADGDGAEALADVVHIHRLGMHVAGEPLLVSGLVGRALDAVAIQTLEDVLPRLERDDLPRLDAGPVREIVGPPMTFQRAFLGEEALGLATLAGLADGTRETSTLAALRGLSAEPTERPFDEPLSLLYRCFLLPADITNYRSILHRYQAVVAALSRTTAKSSAAIGKQTAGIEDELRSRRAGVFTMIVASPLGSVIKSQLKAEALHAAAGVLVAATRARLAGGTLPTALVPDTIRVLPRDPFTADAALVARRSDTGWVVYSVGPDGEDDGGPLPAGSDAVEGNDDVGLKLSATWRP
ncbi:MAG: hypothetical protein ACK6CT_11270 [Planctomycetia bacterium]